MTLSAARSAIAVRVSTVADPRCGTEDTSAPSRPGCTAARPRTRRARHRRSPGLERRDERRLVDDRTPRGVDEVAVDFIARSSAAPMRWWVAGVSGQWRETTSDAVSSSRGRDPGAERFDGPGSGPSGRRAAPPCRRRGPTRRRQTDRHPVRRPRGSSRCNPTPRCPVRLQPPARRCAHVARQRRGPRVDMSTSAIARSAVASVSTAGRVRHDDAALEHASMSTLS